MSPVEAVRGIGVTEQTYYRWRKEYGGLKLDQAKRLKDLEKENTRLKRAVADPALDALIFKEARRAQAGSGDAGADDVAARTEPALEP